MGSVVRALEKDGHCLKQAQFDSLMHCDLVQVNATDELVANAARVSTLGERAEEANHERDQGLIGFLMKNRHGTPFEHGMFMFRIRVPIFVMREVYTHRIGMSRNEESGRYRQLDGLFYIPGPFRALTQVGKPAAYSFTLGNSRQAEAVSTALRVNSMDAWYRYNELLEAGIANEVARMVLPVNIYSACYITCNARSLMHFLSLRVEDQSSTFPSHPMAEIDALARQMELLLKKNMPMTHKAFCDNGRVAP
jgi:thymidylate synthase (FAD)